MPESTLTLCFADRAALAREHATNLTHGRAFVAGATGPAMFSHCTLVLRHPDDARELHIPCEVVMVRDSGEFIGVALQFRDRAAWQRALSDFMSPPDDAAGDLWKEPPEDDVEAVGDDQEAPSTRPRINLSQERRERMRNLPPQARLQLAQSGVLEERVMLERIYGSTVWELLLRNPRITVPEVATMARKGTMPRPLLELIADNDQWIRQGVIRRALLGNPRLGVDSATKVLRSLPMRELKLVPQQTAYPATVRQAAQRLMRG
jgi:hypothetical protein